MPLADVSFDFDQSAVREDQRAALQQNADYLRRWTSMRVTIEGHADARGTNEYNLALGERRGNAVKDYLVSLGIAADRMIVISKGEESPVCTEMTERATRGTVAATSSSPRSSRSTGRLSCRIFFDDCLGRLSWIGGRDDRPSHHNVARSGRDRLRPAPSSATDRSSPFRRRSANSRRDDREVRAARRADGRRLLRRGDDAVESGLLRHPRQRHHLIEERPLDARFASVASSMLVSTVTPMTSGAARPAPAPPLSAPARAAACIIGTPPDACTLSIQTPVSTAASTACATVFGNVVKLQVEKDVGAGVDEARRGRVLRA